MCRGPVTERTSCRLQSGHSRSVRPLLLLSSAESYLRIPWCSRIEIDGRSPERASSEPPAGSLEMDRHSLPPPRTPSPDPLSAPSPSPTARPRAHLCPDVTPYDLGRRGQRLDDLQAEYVLRSAGRHRPDGASGSVISRGCQRAGPPSGVTPAVRRHCGTATVQTLSVWVAHRFDR